jgi:hypothetical protein
VVGVALGTLIGSYIMEWRIKKALEKYAPLLFLLLGGGKSETGEKRDKLERKVSEAKD